MKRFYKFLMPLAIIMAMAMPVRVWAQATCENGTITVANSEVSTSTTSYFPGYSYYNYSVSEVLVPAMALEGLGEIHSMQFKPAATTAGTMFTNCLVYLANSTLEDLSAGWVQDTSLHLVFTGDLNYTDTTWQTITFDSAFAYNGGSLVVLIFRNHGDYTQGSSFRSYNAGAIMGRYANQDSSPYSLGSLTGTNTTSNVPLYRFTGCYEPVPCARISGLTASALTPYGATLTWSDALNQGASYTIIDLGDSTVLGTATDTTFAVSGLESDTTYHLGVFANCTNGYESGIQTVTFTTLTSCPNPTHLTADSVTISEIFLSWNAGYEETSWIMYVNDEPIVVESNTYTLTELDINTQYNIRLAALCNEGDTSTFVQLTTRTLAGDPISEFPYTCGFEINEDEENEASAWVLENNSPNGWYVGTAASHGGLRGLYISNNDGASNAYTNNSACVSYAYVTFQMDPGEYAFSFDWNSQGESSWDFLRAAIAPFGTATPNSDWTSSAVAPGFTTVDGGYLNMSSNWQTKTGTFTIDEAGVYNFYFVWRNDGSSGTNPPAAVDNFSLIRNVCPSPSNLTVNVSGDTANFAWTDNNGSAWELFYGPEGTAPNEEDLIQASTNSFEATDLENGFYEAYVRTACGEDASLWVGPVSFSVGVAIVNMATTGSDTLHTCNAIIYDNGGANGNYSTDCQSTLVVYPNQENSMLYVYGTSYTESTWDYLYIYEGVGTSGTVLWNDNISGTMQRTIEPFWVDGPITITFHSDGTVVEPGFELFVSCVTMPDCSRPESFELVTLLADSAEFSWTDNANTTWGIEYGPAGFIRGNENDTNIHWANFTETSGWVENLNPGTSYDFYLVALCEDTSFARKLTAQTPCLSVPDTSLPYHYGFESDEFLREACWRMFNVGNTTAYPQFSSSYAAEGSRSLYFYGYSTSYYSYAVMPLFETPLNELMLYFKLYKTSSTYGSIEVGVMVNPSDISTFQSLGIYQPENISQWESFRVNLASYTGTGRYIAFLQRSTYGTYLDDITVDRRPACPNPVNLTLVGTSTSSAYVTWDYATGYETIPDGYRLTLTGADSTVTVIDDVTATNYMLTGLAASTEYTLTVETECEDAYSEAASIVFSTMGFGCLQVDATQSFSDTIINGTSTNGYIPSYCYYNYSLSQQIFTATEIGHGGQINSIYFKPSAYPVPRNFEIYMGHVAEATASSYLWPNDLTLVYSGTVASMTAGEWNEFPLSTAFNYNGTDNLLITVRDMTGSWSSGNTWYGETGTSTMSRYSYQDSGPYAIGSATGGTGSTFRSSIILAGAPCAVMATCAAPLVVSANVTPTTLDLMWAPGAADSVWTVEHMAAGDANWTVDLTNTSATSHTFTGLQPSTEYTFRVYHLCGTDTFAAVYTVTTLCLPSAIPFTENFDTWATGSAASIPNCWYKSADAYATNSYALSGNKSMYMYSTSSSYSYLVLPQMDAPMDTLMLSFYLYKPNNSYTHTLYVGTMSNPEDFSTFHQLASATPSQLGVWEGFEFNMANAPEGYIAIVSPNGMYSYPYLDNLAVTYYNPCIRPTNVNDSANYAHSAVIYWTDTVASNFEIEYGIHGFALGTGTPVTSTTNNVTLTGLAHSTNYDVYVRGICGSDNSEWSFVHTFATACAPIDVLPHNEDFNNWGTGVLPNCWSNAGSYSATSYGLISNGYNMTGATGGSVYMYASSTATNKTIVTLPAIDTTLFQINQTQVVFNLYHYSSSYGVPAVEVGLTDASGNFDVVDTVYHSGELGTWEVFEVPFDSYTGNGTQVSIRTVLNGSYSYFYMDNVTLELIPTCPRPDSLTVSNATTTTVELGWNERGGATNWIVEYGPRGFQPGTGVGTVVSAGSNPFTLTGIPVAYQGEFYVRSVCSSTDTGEYSRRPCAFETTQIPATLPYHYNFEDAAEWANWQTSSNVATNWFRGTAVADSGSYAMYVSADSGTTYMPYMHEATVNAAAYRDIDFGPIDSSFTLTFRARVGGTISANYDGMMVFLVDPSQATIASNSNITSPWGNVNSLYRIATLRRDTNWNTYTASLDTISGVHRVAFFWFNQNTGGSYPNLGEPVAFDNIDIRNSTCPRQVALQDVANTTSAMLSWQGPANANYEITYRRVGDTANTIVNATTNSYNLTGLTSPAQYVFWVRKLCGAGDTSLYSDGETFNTPCVTITDFPWLEDFENSSTFDCWSQDGDDEWELGAGDGDITSAHSGSQNAVITHSSNGNVTMLISPILALTPGTPAMLSFWHTQQVWAGDQDELRVYYRTSQTDTWHLLMEFTNSIPTWTMDSILLPEVSASFQVAFEMTDGYGYGVGLDDVMITGTGGNIVCDAPAIVSSAATETTASVTFTSEAPANQVAIVTGTVAADDFQPANAIDVADTTYTFQGLTASTDYTIGVRAVCSDELVSDWVLTHVRTDDHPCYTPTGVAVSGETLHGATISWTAGEAIQTTFEVHVYNNTYNETYTVQATSYEVTGLYMNTAYNVEVRAVCGEDNYSEWTAAEPFTTADCVAPTGVTATANGRDVTVSWQSTGATRYRVAYFDEFTSSDNATVVEVENATSTTVTVPEGDMQYSFFVYAYCDNVLSNPSDEVTVDILGIGDVNMSEVNLYPNPASTTVTVSGLEGENTVTVVDMNGRTVYTATATADLTIDLTGMAKGAYFVRITGEQATAVRKLIVR